MSKSAMRYRKLDTEKAKPTKEKLLQIQVKDEEYSQKQPVPVFEAKNSNQKLALAMFRANKSVIFLVGSAGTGKSMLASYRAACLLKQKIVDKLYLIRPAVAVGKSVGLLPGSIEEKLAPYFSQTLSHLEKFMGKGFMGYCLNNNVIEMKPAEYLRGMSFEDSMVIIEESQNFTEEEFEMVLTRLGNNCNMIFTGDEKQHDLKGGSGLEKTLNKIQDMLENSPDYMSDEDLDIMGDSIGVIRFTPDDVVRNGLTKAFVKMYYNS